jgi:hypothetical protein
MILALRTDKNPTEIYALNVDGGVFREKIWDAGRDLARDLLREIVELFRENSEENEAEIFAKIDGIIVYEGPGSFTGLRIGITVANALAYAENTKIVGVNGEDWLENGLKKLREKTEKSSEKFAKIEDDFAKKMNEKLENETDENGVIFAKKSELEKGAKLEIVVPKYGGEAHITAAKK